MTERTVHAESETLAQPYITAEMLGPALCHGISPCVGDPKQFVLGQTIVLGIEVGFILIFIAIHFLA